MSDVAPQKRVSARAKPIPRGVVLEQPPPCLLRPRPESLGYMHHRCVWPGCVDNVGRWRRRFCDAHGDLPPKLHERLRRTGQLGEPIVRASKPRPAPEEREEREPPRREQTPRVKPHNWTSLGPKAPVKRAPADVTCGCGRVFSPIDGGSVCPGCSIAQAKRRRSA